MHSRSRLLLLVLLFAAATLALPWAASAQEPVTSRLKLSIGGYIKPEFIYRTNAFTTAPGGSMPGTQNFGFSPIAQKGTAGGDNGLFVAAANESRFAFSLTAPDWRGLKSTAYLEMDFDGDTATTIEGSNATNLAVATNTSNIATKTNNGAFRIRHAYFQLAGEGMGGSWSMLFGQAWETFGLLPFYGGSSVSFGGASVYGGRSPQLTFRHTIGLFRDFQMQTTVGAHADTTNLNEIPRGDMSSRFIYNGWQGFSVGALRAANFGV